MLRFDKTVNGILNRLIFEQDEVVTNTPDDVVEQAVSSIEKRIQSQGDTYKSESEQYFNSGGEYVQRFIDEVNKLQTISDQLRNPSPDKPEANAVNESTLTDYAGEAWELAKKGGQKIADTVLPLIKDPQEFLANLAVENMGKLARAVIGDDAVNMINDSVSENLIYKSVAIFLDPTGILSWPYLAKATTAYEQSIGTEDEEIYQLNLLAAQISVIPGLRLPLGILTLPFKIVFGAGAKVSAKIFGVVGARRVARGLANWIKKPLRTNARVVRGSDRLARAEKGALGKASKKTASNAIKRLPKTIIKDEAALAKAKSSATSKMLGAAKTAAKTTAAAAKAGAVAAKTATIISSGNIPQTIKDWQKKGEDLMKTQSNKPSTLGRFSQFADISTQRR